jgi:hypothetical protein
MDYHKKYLKYYKKWKYYGGTNSNKQQLPRHLIMMIRKDASDSSEYDAFFRNFTKPINESVLLKYQMEKKTEKDKIFDESLQKYEEIKQKILYNNNKLTDDELLYENMIKLYNNIEILWLFFYYKDPPPRREFPEEMFKMGLQEVEHHIKEKRKREEENKKYFNNKRKTISNIFEQSRRRRMKGH